MTKVIQKNEINIEEDYDFYKQIYIDGKLQKEYFYKNKKLNRKGKPAFVVYNISTNEVMEEFFYKDGLLHNDHDFAYKLYFCEDKLYQTVSYQNGKKDGLSLTYNFHGNEIERILFKNNIPINKVSILSYPNDPVYKIEELENTINYYDKDNNLLHSQSSKLL